MNNLVQDYLVSRGSAPHDGLNRLGTASLLALAFLISGRQAEAQRPVLLPVDEARSEPALLATRTDLLSSLRARDFDRAMTFVDDDVKYQSNPGPGKEEIKIGLDYGAGRMSRTLAEEIVVALDLGGSFTTTRGSVKGERQFCAPYVYSAFPSRFEHLEGRKELPWVIVSKDASAHVEPDHVCLGMRRGRWQVTEISDTVFPTQRDAR